MSALESTASNTTAPDSAAAAMAAAAKVREQLDWRGPNGRKSRYVILDRELAAALVGHDDKEKE
jgi:hypothetical protein